MSTLTGLRLTRLARSLLECAGNGVQAEPLTDIPRYTVGLRSMPTGLVTVRVGVGEAWEHTAMRGKDEPAFPREHVAGEGIEMVAAAVRGVAR